MGNMETVFENELNQVMSEPMKKLIENLAGPDGLLWEKQLSKFLQKETCWAKSKKEIQDKKPKNKFTALEPVTTVLVDNGSCRFKAKEKFLVSERRDAEMRISYIDDNFSEWFLSGEGKCEEAVNTRTLLYYKLLKPLAYVTLLEKLGGEERAELFLSEMFSLMQNMVGDNKADCLNIFHIRDTSGTLRAVALYWDKGWNILAYSILNLGGWFGGGQMRVFSRP